MEIIKRFDLSDEFWEQFKIRDTDTKEQMGVYEIGNIANANICTITVNPKEYFEKLKQRSINKKHKGVRRDTPGMDFESYAERINVLRDISCEKKTEKKLIKKKLQVKITEMKMTSVNKVQFASLNDKRYYFSGGTISMPFGHPSLSSLRDLNLIQKFTRSLRRKKKGY